MAFSEPPVKLEMDTTAFPSAVALCSEGESHVKKKRVHGESISPGDFKSLA